MITGIKNTEEQKKILTLIKKKVVEKGDKGELKRFVKSASLVASYGRDALYVLAGYGIGPDTGARILSKQKKGKCKVSSGCEDSSRRWNIIRY